LALVSKPIAYTGLAAFAIGAYVLTEEPAPKTAKAKSKRTASTKIVDKDSPWQESDYTARFAKPTGKLRNLFDPLVKPEPKAAAVAVPTKPVEMPKDVDRVPADLAETEPDWAFTGLATVNGVDMALLENRTTKQGTFVKQGEVWKGTRIMRITAQSLAIVNKDGLEQIVLRFDPNRPATPKSPDGKPTPPGQMPADALVRPVNPGPALVGPIGSNNMQIRPIAPGATKTP